MGSSAKRSRQPRRETTPRVPLSRYYQAEPGAAPASPFARKDQPKNRRRLVFGVFYAILALALLSGIGYSLMLQPQASVSASDYSFHPKSVYLSAVNAQLSQLKNRNKVTFNELSLAAALQKQFPEITDVRTELPFFSQRPAVSLAVAKPSFILASRGQKFIVASNGVAVVPPPGLAAKDGLVTVTDESGFEIKAGSRILSDSAAGFISDLISQCRRAKVPLASLTLPARPQELYLKTDDQPYFVKFYLGGEVLAQAGQFLAARHEFMNTHQPPSLYLDVRVPGRIFYK